ncbi:MAG: hypothetical protein RLZZ609_10 [Cyanobacteriota bacterium]|jgi:hypothetical protein
MKRPYLALATLALVTALSPSPGLLPQVWAEGLFNSAPVQASSFAVLGRPVGGDDWTLVVLEQLRARPFCWTPRPDGLVDPTLNRFDYTGICGRFIDSNGYSLRVADTDLNHTYRLRLQQKGAELQLLASSPSQATELVVGRGTIPRRDRDLFVSLQLEPGWELQRRMFGPRSLNHIYFSNAQPLDNLIAAARGRTPERLALQGGLPLQAPPALASPRSITGRSSAPSNPAEMASQARGLRPSLQSQRFVSPVAPVNGSGASDGSSEGPGPGVVALQVIPYEERIAPDGRPQARTGGQDQAQGL